MACAWMRRGVVWLSAALVGLALAAPAWAAPPVTNTNDSGPGSLRDAIDNSNPGDTIEVPAGTYSLTSGQLQSKQSITLHGAGARSTIIDAGGHSRVIFAQDDLTISGITITGGRLDLNGSFTDCQGGGGICQFGNLTLIDSAVVGNQVNATDLTTNAVGGGGIFNNGDVLTITGSTVSGNQVTSNNGKNTIAHGGGGIFDNGDGPRITNSTIANNSVTVNGGGSRHGGGGIYLNGNGQSPTINNSTVAGNSTGGTAATSGGGIFVDNFSPSVQTLIKDSIVANGTSPGAANCAGFANPGNHADVTSSGGNLENVDTCAFHQSTDKPNTDPLLQALANNGGQTDTMALRSGSPAIDAAVDCPPPATDQRGVSRPQFNACDIGAFELAPAQAGPPAQPVACGSTAAKPTVRITSNQHRRTYRRGQKGTVKVTASSPNGLQRDPSTRSRRISTSRLGRHRTTATAVDKCGIAKTTVFSYRVVKAARKVARRRTVVRPRFTG
jgi:hypothetical protein